MITHSISYIFVDCEKRVGRNKPTRTMRKMIVRKRLRNRKKSVSMEGTANDDSTTRHGRMADIEFHNAFTCMYIHAMSHEGPADGDAVFAWLGAADGTAPLQGCNDAEADGFNIVSTDDGEADWLGEDQVRVRSSEQVRHRSTSLVGATNVAHEQRCRR